MFLLKRDFHMLMVTGLCPSSSLKFRSPATRNRHKIFCLANKGRTTRTLIHQIWWSPNSVNGLFSTTTAVPFSLSLLGRAFSQWLRKSPAIPVSRNLHSTFSFGTMSTFCQRPCRPLFKSLSQKTSLRRARRRSDMKNWCVYLCFHMRPISRTLPSLAEVFLKNRILRRFSRGTSCYFVFSCAIAQQWVTTD